MRQKSARRSVVCLGTMLGAALGLASCRESTAPACVGSGGGGTGTVPLVGHVVVVVEENTDYANVICGSSMPYLSSLVKQYGLATQYYANTHPSIGNYFMMTVGKIITNDDGFSGTVSDDNIVRELVAAGKTWKSYAEDLPSVGYTGGSVGNYARKHNPLSYLSDVVNDLWDVEVAFRQLQRVSHAGTRVVLNFYSRLWEVPLDRPLPGARVQ